MEIPMVRPPRLWSSLILSIVFCLVNGANTALAQSPDQPWMNTRLSPEKRAELVLTQMTLAEKIALLHGNGMQHAPQWQMPLTSISNGGAGYVEGVPRLGIPPLFISDAAYGIRDSGANGRYSTALPSDLAAASSWDPQGACEYGALIGRELRAQGFNMTLGGGVNLTREPRNGRTFEYAGEDPLLAGICQGQESHKAAFCPYSLCRGDAEIRHRQAGFAQSHRDRRHQRDFCPRRGGVQSLQGQDRARHSRARRRLAAAQLL